jgi:hypothetical protein
MADALTEGRRGLKAFRLSDVPLDIRYRAKERLLKVEPSPTVAVLIGLAADAPSERVYWIPAEAWDREAAKQTWTRAEAKR